MTTLSTITHHRNPRIPLSAIPAAAWEKAWALASDSEWIRAIARDCHSTVEEVMGPAADAAAKIIARGDDPNEHIGLVLDGCRRELIPPTPLVDPHALHETAETITYYVPTSAAQEPQYLRDARRSPRTGRRRAQARRIAQRAGQMDLLLRAG